MTAIVGRKSGAALSLPPGASTVRPRFALSAGQKNLVFICARLCPSVANKRLLFPSDLWPMCPMSGVPRRIERKRGRYKMWGS